METVLLVLGVLAVIGWLSSRPGKPSKKFRKGPYPGYIDRDR